MNRNLCVLVVTTSPFLMTGGFKDGRLIITNSEKVSPRDVGGILQSLSKQGFSVFVDETAKRYAVDYPSTPLLGSSSSEPIIMGAIRAYIDLSAHKLIEFKNTRPIHCNNVYDYEIEENGTEKLRVDQSELTVETRALLLMCYQATHANITHAGFLDEMFAHINEPDPSIAYVGGF